MSRLDLAARTAALENAAHEGEGRLAPELLDAARAVAERARERGGLSAEHTVVALAGATGSGKSSVFNAVAGQDVAVTGVRRPTTSHALAAYWGDGAGPLLAWLEVARHVEMSGPPPADDATGLVLLDLPDHDSVVVDHRLRAEALVGRADLLVWVVDPQKYADAALHEGFLRPLAGRSDVVVVVLNQIDRLAPDETRAMLADLKRLVAADGLDGARVLGLSAATGEGMDELRALLAKAARKREAATARLVGDERAAASDIVEACGAQPPARAADRARGALLQALEDAAGVTVVVDAVRATARRDARAATGWPLTRWLGRLRRDPLRRLGLRGVEQRAPQGREDLVRTSLPSPAPAVRAAAATGVRRYVESVTDGVADSWVLAARARAQQGIDDLPDALDQAVASTRLEAGRRPLWWRAVNVLQWTLIAAVGAGLAWLAVLFLFSYLRLPAPPTPVWTVPVPSGDGTEVVFPGATPGPPDGLGVDPFQIPWPTLLVLGGLLLGVLVALVSRVLAAIGARRRAAVARRRLRAAVAEVADRLVRRPVGEELAALGRCRTAATIAAS
ncbi:GTPase [Myceligenerans pegani]|uniref:50S ribosome-binding GTPase n=1 Tax=Myceligenerans pegani TaxID=2776917 RepID=A0ABR9N0Y4_9MICO|nr:GTPase [Myceligenerans sp. TRM 65318]MBE1877319.1 50S ribosome-binding GTPase [Myceligenerans sp. TRM 65318]MBE3019590.1 50S ribosome-binding GTPase [Myceligenerans sp. TRM 65318]